MLLLLLMPVIVRAQNSSLNSPEELEIYLGQSNDLWGHSVSLKSTDKARSKRSVVQLYNMITCATRCNPLDYKGYGCYCGFLGSGHPTDPIDTCCMKHDWCYNSANCPLFLEYFVPYVWTCHRRRPLCGVGYSCGQRLCECDRKFAECLARYRCPRSKSVCTSSPWRLLQNLIML
ncbi:basic phospholipase A2 PA-12C [Halyomorpha halys]|uniref:basic phospholipase A2 PA-12C n=1 Tax=Halyomorpha halys TaxID=286706 RepID=UPI0006D50731|nr:basic phospholipase A2 PA-12C [Halyomorpha halys]